MSIEDVLWRYQKHSGKLGKPGKNKIAKIVKVAS